jgi:hypothetical protein
MQPLYRQQQHQFSADPQVLAGCNLSRQQHCSTSSPLLHRRLAGCRMQPLCSQQQYQLSAAPQASCRLQEATPLQSAAVPAPCCSTGSCRLQPLYRQQQHQLFAAPQVLAGCNLSTGSSSTSSLLLHRFLQVATSLQAAAAPALRCSTGSCRLHPLYRQQQQLSAASQVLAGSHTGTGLPIPYRKLEHPVSAFRKVLQLAAQVSVTVLGA